MQEDRNKKIKSFLTKLLVVVLLVGISLATYKVNLSQLIHDFVMRFFDSAFDIDSGDDNDDVSEDDENNNAVDNDSENTDNDGESDNSADDLESSNKDNIVYKFFVELFGDVIVEASESESLVVTVNRIINEDELTEALSEETGSLQENHAKNSASVKDDIMYSLSDNLTLSNGLKDDDREAFCAWLKDYRALRETSHEKILNQEYLQSDFKNLNSALYQTQVQRSIYLKHNFEDADMKIIDARCYYGIEDLYEEGGKTCLEIYEWTSLKYSMNGIEDVMGYGLWHTVCIEDEGKITDSYVDTFLDEELEDLDLYGNENNSQKSYLSNTSIKSVSSYDGSAAVAYADKYATSYNPSYSDYNSIGGDCANFVSQCLYAGGLKMTDGWYWKSYEDRSGSWAYCPSQVEYLSKNCGTLIENPDDSKVLKGNPVYYYSSEKDRYSHAAICVGENSAGVPIVNAHNSDRYHVPWQLGSNWSKRCTILISDTGNDTSAPVISDIIISELTNQGFRVSMKVSDNVAVSTVYIPVWTQDKGQDDIVWHKAAITGTTATCYISAASHGYEGGNYIVNIYAYDAAGNETGASGGVVNVDRTVPAGTQKGDATLDGKINLTDAVYVLRIALGICRCDDMTAADYDGNGTVNLIDAQKVLNSALNII